MVYQNKFIASIQVNGKTLTEHGDVVKIQNQSEYSIYLKNLENRDAKISILIDGKSIGDDILIKSSSSLNLERFISNDRKFKFIKKTIDIEEYRGNKPEDGIVEIRYAFKYKPVEFPSIYRYSNPYQPCYNPYKNYDYITYNSNISNGITVQGSKSDQILSQTINCNLYESYSTIIFKLECSEKTIDTKSKKKCPSCRKKWKSKYEYCPNDGTYLN